LVIISTNLPPTAKIRDLNTTAGESALSSKPKMGNNDPMPAHSQLPRYNTFETETSQSSHFGPISRLKTWTRTKKYEREVHSQTQHHRKWVPHPEFECLSSPGAEQAFALQHDANGAYYIDVFDCEEVPERNGEIRIYAEQHEDGNYYDSFAVNIRPAPRIDPQTQKEREYINKKKKEVFRRSQGLPSYAYRRRYEEDIPEVPSERLEDQRQLDRHFWPPAGPFRPPKTGGGGEACSDCNST